jgi:hypothetical protein
MENGHDSWIQAIPAIIQTKIFYHPVGYLKKHKTIQNQNFACCFVRV